MSEDKARVLIVIHDKKSILMFPRYLSGRTLDEVLKCHGCFVNGNMNDEDLPDFLKSENGQSTIIESLCNHDEYYQVFFNKQNECEGIELFDFDYLVVCGEM